MIEILLRLAAFLLFYAVTSGDSKPEDPLQFLEVTGCGSPTDKYIVDGVYRRDLDSEDEKYEGLAEWGYLSRVTDGRWEILDGFSDLPMMRSSDLKGPWEKLNEDEATYSMASDLCTVQAVCRVAKCGTCITGVRLLESHL